MKSLLLLSFALLCAVRVGAAPPTASPRMILVICDALTLDDLHDSRYPTLSRLAETGAVGLMNCAVAGPKTPASALMAMALGEQQPALPSDEQVYQVGEPAPNEEGSAGAAYMRQALHLPPTLPWAIVNLGIRSLISRGLHSLTLGAILASASPPVRAFVCGNADTDTPGRRAALLCLDADGQGEGDMAISVPAPDLPFGKEDPNAQTLLRAATEVDHGLIVVQLGDTARLEAARSKLSPSLYRKLRERALRRLDAFLALLQARLQTDRSATDVMLVSPYPPSGVAGELWGRLTPVLAWGPHFAPGLLTSPTTRTAGLVANIDVAPTVLTLFSISPPFTLVGRPMRSLSGASGPQRLAVLTRLDAIATLNAKAVTQVMIVLGGLCFSIALIGFVVRKLRGATASRRFAPILIFAQNLPASLMLAPLAAPTTLLVYGLQIAAWMAVLTLVCYLLARPLRTTPPVVAALLCILLIMGDMLAGQPLVKESLFCSYALSGIRYYGVGNEYLGVVVGMALTGAFAWLDDRNRSTLKRGEADPEGNERSPDSISPLVSEETPARLPLASCLPPILLWLLLSLMLGWPSLGANAGSLIVTAAGFGVGAMILMGRRPTVNAATGWGLAGLALSFLFSALDVRLAGAGSSHAGSALNAASHGRGIGYLAQIALRKLAMNLRLLFSPWLLLGAGVVAATALAARALIGAEIQSTLQQRPWLARCLPALLAATVASLLFKDSGVVTVTFLAGSAIVIILWYVLTE